MTTPKPEHYENIEQFLMDLRFGNLIVPELQQPFLRSDEEVLAFIEDLYNNRDIGYFFIKKGERSNNPFDAIVDGQQKTIAMMAVFLGREVLTTNYGTRRIIVSFNPITEEFRIQTPEILLNPEWIADISIAFKLITCGSCYYSEYQKINGDKDNVVGIFKLFHIERQKIKTINLQDRHGKSNDTQSFPFDRYSMEKIYPIGYDFFRSKGYKATRDSLNTKIDHFCFLTQSPEYLKRLKEEDSPIHQKGHIQTIMPAWIMAYNEGKMELLSNDIYHPNYFDILSIVFNPTLMRDYGVQLYDNMLREFRYHYSYGEFSFGYLDSMNEKIKKQLGEIIDKVTDVHSFNKFIKILKSIPELPSDFRTRRLLLNSLYLRYLQYNEEGDQTGTSVERAIHHRIERFVREVEESRKREKTANDCLDS